MSNVVASNPARSAPQAITTDAVAEIVAVAALLIALTAVSLWLHFRRWLGGRE